MKKISEKDLISIVGEKNYESLCNKTAKRICESETFINCKDQMYLDNTLHPLSSGEDLLIQTKADRHAYPEIQLEIFSAFIGSEEELTDYILDLANKGKKLGMTAHFK